MHYDKKTILSNSLLITLTAVLIFSASSFFDSAVPSLASDISAIEKQIYDG